MSRSSDSRPAQGTGSALSVSGTARRLDVDVVAQSAAWDAAGEQLEAAIEVAARQAFGAAETVPAACCAVTVALLDDAAVRDLNRQFRRQDKPTNVLSFPPADAPCEPGQPANLGDIALAYETVARESAEAGIVLADHLSHLVVHGVLHLLGYDHETEAEAEHMESLETSILAQLGVADPYAR